MSRSSFRQSIFDVVQYLNNYELSDQAKKLILYYFNQSRASTSRLKAVEAIEKYVQEKLPSKQDTSPRLGALLDDMMTEADEWDND